MRVLKGALLSSFRVEAFVVMYLCIFTIFAEGRAPPNPSSFVLFILLAKCAGGMLGNLSGF